MFLVFTNNCLIIFAILYYPLHVKTKVISVILSSMWLKYGRITFKRDIQERLSLWLYHEQILNWSVTLSSICGAHQFGPKL